MSERFAATRINVTDVILDAMRARAAEVGLDWSMILAADAGATADREGLKGFVAQCAPAIIDVVAAANGPVVLTDLSTWRPTVSSTSSAPGPIWLHLRRTRCGR